MPWRGAVNPIFGDRYYLLVPCCYLSTSIPLCLGHPERSDTTGWRLSESDGRGVEGSRRFISHHAAIREFSPCSVPLTAWISSWGMRKLRASNGEGHERSPKKNPPSPQRAAMAF